MSGSWMWVAIAGVAAMVVGFVVAAVAVWQKMAREGSFPAGRRVGKPGGRRPAGPTDKGTAPYDLQTAQAEFFRGREYLEARFVAAAAASGKPRGLAWADCDFETPVVWARDRVSGEIRGLVGLCVRFTAVEGGGMENNPNVGTPRAATAVFRWSDGEWLAEGRVLFNLDPRQALTHFRDEWEPVDMPDGPTNAP